MDNDNNIETNNNDNNIKIVYVYKTPAYVKKAQLTYYDKIKNTDAYKQRKRQDAINYYNRNKDDPEFMKKKIQKSKAYYESNRDKILERRTKKKQDNIINDE
jgi:hypothetical protein